MKYRQHKTLTYLDIGDDGSIRYRSARGNVPAGHTTYGHVADSGYCYKGYAPEVGAKTKQYRAHRLVAEMWIPNPGDLPCVHHINGDKADNRIENLEWCTQAQNVARAYKDGSIIRRHGSELHNAKMTEDRVRLMRVLRRFGEARMSDLARAFSIDRTTVRAICARKTWRHVA